MVVEKEEEEEVLVVVVVVVVEEGGGVGGGSGYDDAIACFPRVRPHHRFAFTLPSAATPSPSQIPLRLPPTLACTC
jgi:hypothetical protein